MFNSKIMNARDIFFRNLKVKKFIVIVFLLVVILLILLTVNVNAVVSPTNDFYVNDYADVLSSETEQYIINTNVNLQEQTGAQVVVVTITSLDGKSIEEYATELFRNFGIGDKEKNNGVLLLCTTGEREFRIEVGYGLEGALPDGKTGRIQDQYIIPYLKQDNYNDGILNGYNAVLETVSEEYGVTIDNQAKPKAVNSNIQNSWVMYYGLASI